MLRSNTINYMIAPLTLQFCTCCVGLVIVIHNITHIITGKNKDNENIKPLHLCLMHVPSTRIRASIIVKSDKNDRQEESYVKYSKS